MSSRTPSPRLLLVALLIACPLAAPSPAGAQLTASPAPAAADASPVPSPSPSPRPRGVRLKTAATATLIDQSTAGPGQVGPEAAGFAAGSPLSPNTPYDLFSSAPQVPGVAGIGAIVTTATYRTRTLDFSVTPALGYVRGSVTNAAYYGENLMPALNPHLGSQALPYAIVFPTHAGQDDATALRLSVLDASVATADGRLTLRGGYFDPAQTARFVFSPPPLTSLNPALAYAPAETLSSGVAGSEAWQPYATALPLLGVDLVAKRGIAAFELSQAALPSLPGESARMTMGSLVVDHGEGTQYTAQLVHAATSGIPFTTTVAFGLDPQFTSTPQGVLPTSTLSGQRETIAGLRAAFHLLPRLHLDASAEIGRAWYDASPVGRPGTQRPGGYYHLGLTKAAGRATASLDLYRMEPRYATMILPYGIAENQWSVAFAWPGQWLKSNYQLVDNSVLGVNRQGYRLRYAVEKGPFEVRTEYTDLRQIEPETIETSTQNGFVDGYYLPQAPDAVTFGRQKRYGLWTAWHAGFGDVTLDIVDDTLYRPFAASHPEDRVAYDVPQAVVTYSRRFSPAVVGAIGVGRYAIKGTFAEPVDVAQRLFFVSSHIRESAASSLLLTFRRTALRGLGTFPAARRSPDFTGEMLVVEQRLVL